MSSRTPSIGSLQISVALAHTVPLIWRRLVLVPDLTLADLHRAIQATMGWQDYHLHSFNVRGEEYGVPHQHDQVKVYDERTLTLREALPRVRSSIFYTYDFGDNWVHQVRLEARLPDPAPIPRCRDGARACPPEDCGGPWGYTNLLETLADPDHPDYATMLEWLGGDFDPEAFDLDETNLRLATVFGT